MIPRMQSAPPPLAPDRRPLIVWLLACAGLVLAMTVIGAVTRLTESGLSIAVWEPVSGALPPLTPEAWERMFAAYRETPEFRLKNSWMDLEAFKTIFFWEWFHRLFGRLIGLAYALPLAWFWVKGRIPHGWHGRLLTLLGLGIVQGALGWYMVASGLVDRPSVSHLRLAAHLGLATLIAGLMLWFALALRQSPSGPEETFLAARPALRRALAAHGLAVLGLTAVTMLWGAFTAGLDAGMVYNTFPLMGGRIVPPELGFHTPLVYDLTHNPVSVQFVHRWLGVTTCAAALSFTTHALRRGVRGWVFLLPGGMALVQVALGIATLVLGVPLALAAAHQAGALILMAMVLAALSALSRASRPALNETVG